MTAMAAALAAFMIGVLGAAATAAPSEAAPRSATTDLPVVEGVPVLGQAWFGSVADDRLAVLTIHGVRRIEGATVLYYSMGLRAQDRTGEKAAYFDTYGNGNNYVLNQNGASRLVCTAAAIDVGHSVAYSALRTDEVGRCLSTDNLDLQAPSDDLGKAPVGWVLLAEIPPGLSTVDVLVGSQLVQSVPVEDGLLEPQVPDPAPAVGTGWPTVDTSGLPGVVDANGAVFALRSQVEDVQKQVTRAKKGSGDELELNASVLFATDKATLTSKADAVIAEAAKQVTAAGSTGSITVTGHTDNVGTDAYNLALSKRRAAAVAQALKPKIPKGITITTVGKGESEPIADNSTPAGRALNRRVTITLPS